MESIMMFISQYYIAVCIGLLAIQVSLLIAAIRTEKDIFFGLCAALSVLSCLITFNIPCAQLDLAKGWTLFIFLVLDTIVLFTAMVIRTTADDKRKLTPVFKGIWLCTVLGAVVMILHKLFI